MVVDQTRLLSDDAAVGAAWSTTHSAGVDRWLTGLFEEALGPEESGVALVAIGSYGRSELCPQSDIDVMVVHGGRSDIGAAADRIWYPARETGLRLAHTVCTLREALDGATDTLDTATALLSARHVAGDPAITGRLAEAALGQWQKQSKRFLAELGTRVDLRHQTAGEVAFRLEPDLKEGRGGLRDVQALRWAEAGERILLEHDQASLATAYAVLLDVRVELQRVCGRPGNVLALQDQESVARTLGMAGDDELMRAVASAARTIAWTSDDTWRRIRSALRGPAGGANGRARELEGGLRLRDGEIYIGAAFRRPDTTLALRVAAAAAEQQSAIDRDSLEQLAAAAATMPDPWPAEARQLFLDLLLRGQSAVAVVEALDQRGIWARILPEWAAVRARPQRNPYHRYTVDRHLLETVAAAARLAARVDRPDLLVLAALLHDLGKGFDRVPDVTGVELATTIATRIGLPSDDTATVAWLVERHQLLPEVAGRRDLDDSTTIDRVASVVGTPSRLALLAALTEADALATGPAAWGPTRSRLVAQLVERVALVLSGRTAASIVEPRFPSTAQLERLAAPGRSIDAAKDVLTIVTDDRLGVFSRVAGVLALHGLDVVAASAYSSDDGRALSEFRVADSIREIPWPRVVADVELGLDGRLAIPARLAERAQTYARVRRSVAPRAAIKVTFDDAASADATVLDVQAPDAMGALYRITRVFADLDIDIRSARVQTMGNSVVDSFYVRDRQGLPVSAPALRAEIERALLHSLSD